MNSRDGTKTSSSTAKSSRRKATNERKLTPKGAIFIRCADIKVGDVLRISRGKRVPADMVLLHTK